MSVYIPGMEMPTSCYLCPCSDLEYFDCNLTPGTRIEHEKRLPNCPLIPVPEHGRLIDADALMENAEYKGTYDIVTAWDIVATPTIIPADKEGEG